MSTTTADRQAKLAQELREIETQIAGYVEKNQVQQKRIKFLKRQNQQLRQKEQQNCQTSEQILQQNTTLKKRNRQLKNKLNEIKKMLQATRTNKGPQTTTIKDIVVSHKTQQLDLPKSEITDQDIECIKYFPNIKTLILAENGITDVGCGVICDHLPNLRKLFINNNKITHEGIRNIGKLANLRCLDLRVNQIGDIGMPYIYKLVQLTQLSVSNNGLTDEGLSGIEALQNLRYLDLTSNQISNKGGLAVGKLRNLSNLYLSHNRIQTVVGVKLVELPELKVLDLRFNDISKEEKGDIKSKANPATQLFL